MRANNHRALVFSQFVDCLAIVWRALDERGWTYKYLDGATPKAEREREVAAFQSGEGDFFLISLKAGGMGLNLPSLRSAHFTVVAGELAGEIVLGKRLEAAVKAPFKAGTREFRLQGRVRLAQGEVPPPLVGPRRGNFRDVFRRRADWENGIICSKDKLC